MRLALNAFQSDVRTNEHLVKTGWKYLVSFKGFIFGKQNFLFYMNDAHSKIKSWRYFMFTSFENTYQHVKFSRTNQCKPVVYYKHAINLHHCNANIEFMYIDL